MANTIVQGSCETACTARFIECTKKSYTGCVETLRVCRENCGQTPPKTHSPIVRALLA